MNPTGKPVQLKPNYKILSILAVIALVIFLFTQVIPLTASETLEVDQTNVISQEKAIASADAFKNNLPLDPEMISRLKSPAVSYHTDSELSGYVAKEKLSKQYSKQLEKIAPYDIFRVHYKAEGYLSSVDIDVHMNTGKVVAFLIKTDSDTPMDTSNPLSPKPTSANEGNMTLTQKVEQARPVLKTMGYDPNALELQTNGGPGLDYVMRDGGKLDEAQLHLKFTFEEGELRSFQPELTPPSSYTSYIEKQTTLAYWLTFAGYGLFTLVLGVLAIVFASLKRKHTSFKRGIVLSLIYCAVSVISVVNMWPYFEASFGGEGYGVFMMLFLVALQLILNVMMAVLLYFSLVGGDGLWRERGMNMWPRSREIGYGKYVLHSAAVGYLFAIILLGVQSIIYLFLENALGIFSSSDDSSSPYNMAIPALLPLLAWMAGIGEEGVYRLFGIGMLKKLLRNTFVASAITSIIWALGHTLYPIYPVYARPVELLIIGLLFSLVFLRYGFIAVVFAHVMFDTILMSFSLMTVGGAGNIALGIFYIIMPALIAYIIYLFTRNKGVDNAYPPYTPSQQSGMPVYAPTGQPGIGQPPHSYYNPGAPAHHHGEGLPNDPSRFQRYQEPQAPAAPVQPPAPQDSYHDQQPVHSSESSGQPTHTVEHEASPAVDQQPVNLHKPETNRTAEPGSSAPASPDTAGQQSNPVTEHPPIRKDDEGTSK
ncbi:CPBP family intramembrane glutamate endopeptidase [Paenibacillus sp. Z6-24]